MSDDLNAKVRERAYAIWERENRPEGKHLEHWVCAEAEIEAEQSAAAGQAEQSVFGSPDPTGDEIAESVPEGGGKGKRRPA